jgi:hypothetical protein
MRSVQITRFGGPEVLDVIDVPEPTPGDGQQLYDVSTAGINFADTHQPSVVGGTSGLRRSDPLAGSLLSSSRTLHRMPRQRLVRRNQPRR